MPSKGTYELRERPYLNYQGKQSQQPAGHGRSCLCSVCQDRGDGVGQRTGVTCWSTRTDGRWRLPMMTTTIDERYKATVALLVVSWTVRTTPGLGAAPKSAVDEWRTLEIKRHCSR